MNSSQRMAAKRYALAYDETSPSLAQAQARAQELFSAVQILAGVSVPMQSPRISSVHKKLIINETLRDWPHAAAFINVLIDAKRYHLLPEICKWVDQLLDDRRGISRAVVTSAKGLSQAQQEAARKALSARYGKTVEAVFKTDPALLGGLKITCNGELIDGSIAHRLEKLQEEITK
ncbi:MAG: ATP synthase F1 subunit delta [Elusimicrobiaceae bacterium]|nr:ATP synthase F1 subunit delta [Elusimicrobiaceae bacterium]MBP5617298.1 ATP synthase F1 subunit delta [Elusimicrobiaceae bacterium]